MGQRKTVATLEGRMKKYEPGSPPYLGFLYTTGWIGTAGRKYLRTVAKTKNPAEKEIIIDVPLALTIMFSNFVWPIESWNAFIAGDLVADKEEITVSPR